MWFVALNKHPAWAVFCLFYCLLCMTFRPNHISAAAIYFLLPLFYILAFLSCKLLPINKMILSLMRGRVVTWWFCFELHDLQCLDFPKFTRDICEDLREIVQRELFGKKWNVLDPFQIAHAAWNASVIQWRLWLGTGMCCFLKGFVEIYTPTKMQVLLVEHVRSKY